VTTAPPAGVTYASAAVRSPPMMLSSRSDHTNASLSERERPRGCLRPRALRPQAGRSLAARQQRRRYALDRLLAVAHRRIAGREDGDRERDPGPLQPANLVEQPLRGQRAGLEEHLPARPRHRRGAPALRRLDTGQKPARVCVELPRNEPFQREEEARLI